MSILEDVKDKSAILDDFRGRMDFLLKYVEEKQKTERIVLPGFEAYGWSRLEEFFIRLEDAVISPLVEKARIILSDAKIDITEKSVDELKKGLGVRKEALIETLRIAMVEKCKITIPDALQYCNIAIKVLVENGKWDQLLPTIIKWQQLNNDLEPIVKIMSNETLMYNAVFKKILEEGPETVLFKKLREAETRASLIGGKPLEKSLRFEEIDNPIDPLKKIEDTLTDIAEKKEEIRNLQGDDIAAGFFEERCSLDNSLKRIREELSHVRTLHLEKQKIVSILVAKQNELADLLGKTRWIYANNFNIKQLGVFEKQLCNEITALERALESSFSSDAKVFIESIFDGKLPDDWEPNRTVDVLKELLKKRVQFKVSWKS